MKSPSSLNGQVLDSFWLAMHNPDGLALRQEERGRMVIIVENQMLNWPGQTNEPSSSPPLSCDILSSLPHSMPHGVQGICTIEFQEAKHWLFSDIMCQHTDVAHKPQTVLKKTPSTHSQASSRCLLYDAQQSSVTNGQTCASTLEVISATSTAHLYAHQWGVGCLAT